MNFILNTILLMILAAALQWFLPWWTLTLVCFIIGLAAFKKNGAAFFCGFLGIAFLWGGAAFFIDFQNEGLLSGKVAQLLQLPESWLLIVASALLGGIIGGLSALSGQYLRKMFMRPLVSRY